MKKNLKNLRKKTAFLTGEKADLRALVENAHDPVIIVDSKDKIVYANKKASKITGYSLYEIIGRDSAYFLRSKEYNRLLDLYKKEMEKGLFPRQFQTVFFNKNKKEITADVVVTQVKWEGEPASFAIIRDISKQKETEIYLEGEKVKLETLVDNLPSLVWFKDKNLRYIKVNKEFARVVKVSSPEKIVGKTAKEIWPPKLAKRYLEEDKKTLKSKNIIRTEETVVNVEGEEIHFESIKGPIKNKDGEVLGTFGISQDITKFKLSEDALKESEERFRTVIEDLPMLICRLSPKGIITFVNKNYCDYFKKTEEELIGTDFLELVPKRNREHARKRFFSLTPENPSVIHEHRIKIPSGDFKWQRWIDRAIFNKDGTVKAYQSIGEDITEDKETHDRLVESYKYLGTVNRQMAVLFELNQLLHSDEKSKKKIIDYIAWSALEVSNSDFVVLYKFNKKRKVFYLASLASHMKIEEKEKSKITSIPIKSNKTLQSVIKDSTIKIRQCFENANLRKFSKKYKMKYCYVLPLLYKKKIEGVILMGYLTGKKISSQQEGFYQVFSMYTSYLFSNNDF